MSPQYGELQPTSGWVSLVWGTPANFNCFRVLAALLHGSQVVSISQTLRRWAEGATYVRQGDHHVGHWNILVPIKTCSNNLQEFSFGCPGPPPEVVREKKTSRHNEFSCVCEEMRTILLTWSRFLKSRMMRGERRVKLPRVLYIEFRHAHTPTHWREMLTIFLVYIFMPNLYYNWWHFNTWWSRVQLPAAMQSVTTLGKLFTLTAMPLSASSITWCKCRSWGGGNTARCVRGMIQVYHPWHLAQTHCRLMT